MPTVLPRSGRSICLLWLLPGALLVLGACRGTMPIGTILDDPGRYDGRTVRISGTVAETVGALGQGAYRIDDGTGTMNVVTEHGGVPREGAKVGVEGEFKALFTFGAQSQAVLLEKRRFTP